MVQAPSHAPDGPRARGRRIENNLEGQPNTDPPDWLNTKAHPAWWAAIDLLTSVRIISKSDLVAVARYCKFLTEWIDLTANIDANGHTSEDRFGQMKANPSVAMRDAVERSIRSLEKALGLDPQSHADLTRDINKALKDKNKVRGRRGAGGFLNQKDKT